MNALLEKFKEILISVVPITLIVLIVHFFIAPMETVLLLRFLVGAVFVVVGLAVFLVGVDLSVSPLGEHIGAAISRPNKIWIIVCVGLVVGFFVSIAEPDLMILADEVQQVTSGIITRGNILVVVSIGIAVMMVVGLLRIVYNFSLSLTLLICYGIILVMAFFVSPEFLAIAFDASGATTGALTVPFIMALAVGISSMKKDSLSSEEDSFGLLGVTSTGAVLAVLAMGVFSNIGELSGTLPMQISGEASVFKPFLYMIPSVALESATALLPILVIFVVFQLVVFRFSAKRFRRLVMGLLYTFIGLVIFLTGVNAGFMEVGSTMGMNLAATGNTWLPIIVGFVLGLVTILAEPAVYVLTHRVETVTAGYVKRSVVLGAISIGVGLAVALSIIRILVPGIQLWHYLLPGYAISILLSFFVPKLFVGIAFDSGGVASGPMTATFILAFAQGVAEAVPGASVLTDAFGMIALVAMTPIITLQVLGLMVQVKAKRKEAKKGIEHEAL
ncbi:DUF1538 domain-containing protein [Eubacteriales bacterium OttesenSCG-928-N13]|nr:DUF1538 domain-containing protein [Eubacteriales bacterium OttesenSCG-928-N13]